MILLRGRAATYGELWFDEAPPAATDVDILQYRFRGAPVENARATPLLTLLTDLAPEEGALLERFGKDCRYKIRRADAKDGLAFEYGAEPARRSGAFAEFFDAFARQKGHAPCDRAWLRAACDAGQLALSAAYRDDIALVWHAHVLCAGTAGLQYTASHFRGQDNEFRALVGRANRWLHWQEMRRFKSMGLTRYDWGGLFPDESTPERAGINRFKRDFGGEETRVYECTGPVSARGRVYLPLRDAWRRLAA
jgi:lipid II:glycine glycyltransferase (peptidoglycan interpeptide bridge formation enzyme)